MALDPNNCIKNVRERLSSMLQSGRWTDCKFLVGTELQVVEAHKSILASASPVFEAMFFGEMAENQTEISIPDIQPAAFKAMLQYIYTNDIKLTSLDEAIDLYYVAKKFLPNLEKLCINHIESILSTKNLFRTYEFASMFDEKNLMDKCLDFIDINVGIILSNTSRFEDAQLSTLVMIFSLDSCTEYDALYFFEAVERYVQAHVKSVVTGTNCETDCKSLSHKSSECSVLNDMALVNGENNAEDSKEASKKSLGLTAPSPIGSQEEPNIRPLLEKIHFLTLTPEIFAEGPALSGLLTESEAYAILMNIVSNKTNVPMPSGFSTLRIEDERGIFNRSKICKTCNDYCGH